MRYNTTINNVKAKEWNLDIKLAYLFAWMYELPSWADKSTIEGKDYYFASKNKAIDELPLLTDKRDTMYRYYKQLESLNLIEIKKIDTKDYICLTSKAKEWNGYKSDTSDKNPNKLGYKSENPSDKNPTYNNTISYNKNKYNENSQKVSQPENQTHLENNETLLKEVEKVMLPKNHYLDLYNRASRAFKKQKSNIKRLNLGNETYDNFNEIYKTYTVGELKTALKGLMIQKNALNSIFTPHHLLKDNMFETYLNAGQNAIRTLYSQSQDKDTKKGML